MKHSGPSAMVSATPVHKLSIQYHVYIVKEVTIFAEKSSGVVLGSITDNCKVNQLFCKLFNSTHDFQSIDPLDNSQCWHILFDIVHLLKCLHNWTTDRSHKLSLDKKSVASSSNMQNLLPGKKKTIF